MNLHDALERIDSIHGQMARASVFRGYRSWTTAFSGVVAGVTAVLQPMLVPAPMRHPAAYIQLWMLAAVVCLLVAAVEMVIRVKASGSQVQGRLTTQAAEQFLPALAAGGLVTFVLLQRAPETVWSLPGLWQVFFALGILASCRILPRGMVWAGGYYLVTGLAMLAWGRGPWAFHPAMMGVPFGLGQLGIAGLLYWRLERRPNATREGCDA